MMVGTGEGDRYLAECLRSLGQFVEAIAVVDESTDGATAAVLGKTTGLYSHERVEPGMFFRHEGRARQLLLEVTLEQKPTHILAIDCDELVSDGQALRALCEADEGNGAWALSMDEVWKADDRALWTRQDGGWRSHHVPILYRAPTRSVGNWRIQDRQLACGREPIAVRSLAARAVQTGVSVFHFGWARESERQTRYQRYAEADGGRFHASAHLNSILFPDRKVRLARRSWPPALEPVKAAILERVRS